MPTPQILQGNVGREALRPCIVYVLTILLRCSFQTLAGPYNTDQYNVLLYCILEIILTLCRYVTLRNSYFWNSSRLEILE